MANYEFPPLRFSGLSQETKVKVTRKEKEEDLYPYIPDPNLVKAVNVALLLQKPLLIMGEPGCGKSLLAKAVAYDIYKKNMYAWYDEWPVKSTSKAKDGLYEFDQIHRLRDATVTGGDGVTSIEKYIHLGPLGRAFKGSVAHDKRFVLLIDEIDKADIDFPNDLLNELDRMEFEIPEMKIEEKEKNLESDKSLVKADFRPIVIITSNSEKELPDAFLRRCVFHYIEPLDEAMLKKIVWGRYYGGTPTEDPLITEALQLFLKLRSTIATELLSLTKNVSTSEFLDWFETLKYFSQQKPNAPENENIRPLIEDLKNLKLADVKKIPYNHILLKNINSVLRFNEKTTTS